MFQDSAPQRVTHTAGHVALGSALTSDTSVYTVEFCSTLSDVLVAVWLGTAGQTETMPRKTLSR